MTPSPEAILSSSPTVMAEAGGPKSCTIELPFMAWSSGSICSATLEVRLSFPASMSWKIRAAMKGLVPLP